MLTLTALHNENWLSEVVTRLTFVEVSGLNLGQDTGIMKGFVIFFLFKTVPGNGYYCFVVSSFQFWVWLGLWKGPVRISLWHRLT